MPSPHRLRKHYEFVRVQRKGVRFNGQFLIFFFRLLPVETGYHFGLVVSKKVGKAHDRNLVKRRLRHAVSIHCASLKGFHLVILAKKNIVQSNFKMLEEDFIQLLAHINKKR